MKFQHAVSLLLLALGVAQAHPSSTPKSELRSSSPPTYYIDDTDSSISWGVSFLHLDSGFAPITWANTSECYNKTFTVAQGYSVQRRSFTIPFTGSGITLFVAYNNRLGLNCSVTLDNNFTTINWFILDSNYTNSLTFVSYNATLYDIQDLDDKDHSITVELENYQSLESTIMFDYALVTGTRPESQAAARKKRIGAGIGGALGAAAVVAALALILLFVRRRSRRKPQPFELGRVGGDPFVDGAAGERDPDAKDPSLFDKVKDSVRPGHNRRQSSFSQKGNSPISPVTPTYSKYLGGGPKHPWLPLGEE